MGELASRPSETAFGTKEMDCFFPNVQASALGVQRFAGADLCTWGVGLFGLRKRTILTLSESVNGWKLMRCYPSFLWSKAWRKRQTRTSMEDEFASKHLNADQGSGGQGTGMIPDEMVMTVFAQSDPGELANRQVRGRKLSFVVG